MWAAWVAAIAGVAAAFIAAWQIFESRKEAKRQAAFAHIREVEERLQKVWHISPTEARQEILDFYCHKRADLSERAGYYMAYLTALDLLVFACDTGSIDGNIATTWLRGTLQRDDPTLEFIGGLQKACDDPHSFEYLGRHLRHARQLALNTERQK